MKFLKSLAILILIFLSSSSFSQNYANFIGTYTLKTSKKDTIIKYDYIKIDYKTGKLECYRVFKFSNSTFSEQKHKYEIVKLDTVKRTITIRLNNQQATYKFKSNVNGKYDLIVFDGALTYVQN